MSTPPGPPDVPEEEFPETVVALIPVTLPEAAAMPPPRPVEPLTEFPAIVESLIVRWPALL
jgi:hypothetical protein